MDSLIALDKRLKKIVDLPHNNSVDWRFVQQWRETLRAGAELWWWRLDELALKNKQEHGVLSFLTAVFFAGSIGDKSFWDLVPELSPAGFYASTSC